MTGVLPQLRRTMSNLFRFGDSSGGVRTIQFFNGFLGQLTWTPTAARNLVLPDASGVLSLAPILYRAGDDLSIAINQAATGTATQVANTLRAYPFWVRQNVTLIAARTEVTTIAAGVTYRTALYQDNGTGYPGAIITNTDGASNNGGTIGVKTATFAAAVTLTPGLYWSAINNSGASVLRSLQVSAVSPQLGWNGAGGGSANYVGWTIASALGASLPATFPVGATKLANTAPFLAMYRVQ